MDVKTSGAVYEYLAKLGKKGGSQTSDAKAKSSAENGKLGGRPKKNKRKPGRAVR